MKFNKNIFIFISFTMVKRINKKHNKEEKKFNKRTKDKESEIQEHFQTDETGASNKADFYFDDNDLDLVEDEDSAIHDEDGEEGSEEPSLEGGSELDYGEDDYVESEPEEEEGSVVEGEEQPQKKHKKLTKIELKRILKKSQDGVPFALTKLIIIFGRITAPSQKLDSLDEDDLLNKPKIVNKLLKFCIVKIPQILSLKHNNKQEETQIKSLMKRYLSILSRLLKTAEYNLISIVFRDIEPISDLILLFKNFIEIFLKISIKTWSTYHTAETEKTALNALKLVKILLNSRPEYFEISLKLFYMNYLEVAKAQNWHTFNKIKSMQEEIISLLSLDLDKAYLTIFTFVRKLCLQLRATINDKKQTSIKKIYNWQFINAIVLWVKVICKYYKGKSEINLLAYPLIQTIFGVIRLNLVDVFFPLRIILINLLNDMSLHTGIYIPVSVYLLEIIESSNFSKSFREKIFTKESFGNEKTQNKLSKKQQKKKLEHEKENMKSMKSMNKKPQHFNNENKEFDINICLKIKKEEYDNYGVVTNILEETLDSLIIFLAINSGRISFPEIAFGCTSNLRKIQKNMFDKHFKEIIRGCIEKAETHTKFINLRKSEIEGNTNITQLDKILLLEKTLFNDKENLLGSLIQKIKHKKEMTIEARISQREDTFIEV
jgi:hypothetical protein